MKYDSAALLNAKGGLTMRWSETLIPTLREDPQDAEIVSHTLMLRAGLIRKLAGGLYTFLPLGLRALRNVERIVREEMDRAGALELLMPALQPREIWDQSGRYEVMGDTMFRLRDRQDREMVLGPTHEEVITDLAAREISSYRQLPKTFYQIQTKFRDEIRPRFGLMRAKEFIMKDAYSFDAGMDEANQSYQAMYDAYTRIFERCGLRFKVVEADTGAIGGKWSHEFMVLADTGEDGLVECVSCSYAANLERAERAFPAGEGENNPAAIGGETAPKEVATPGRKSIEAVSAFLGCAPDRLIKTLIYLIRPNAPASGASGDAPDVPVAVILPGDRDVNEAKLARKLDAARVALADDATIARLTGAPVGFAGPIGLRIPVYADTSLKGSKDAVTGANKADTHLRHVCLARDANVTAYEDVCVVKDGDGCPRCRGALREKRGIEVGHVFKLGTKYSTRFDASYLDVGGQKQTLVMGCYGIGVTRTLQAIVEQSHDANGIIWPMEVAPYRVAVLSLNPAQPDCCRAVDGLIQGLGQLGIDVLLDDRDERPGVKFKDADLLGFPIRVVIGERSLAQQSVEVKRRTEAKGTLVLLGEVVASIGAMVQTA